MAKRQDSMDKARLLESGEPTTLDNLVEALFAAGFEVVAAEENATDGDSLPDYRDRVVLAEAGETVVFARNEEDGVVVIYQLRDGRTGDWQEDWFEIAFCYPAEAWERHLKETEWV